MLLNKRQSATEARQASKQRQSELLRQNKKVGGQKRFVREPEARLADEDSEDLEDRWRQAAQMLTDDDEFLLGEPRERPANGDELILAPSRSPELAEQEPDDASSISFAQSGCHSILSAWRLKSASRAERAARRPVSVLSTGSRKSLASTAFTGRGKSPASATRIPLGPHQVQHFVTNSRRRRRANELIMSTLEARRRATGLQRAHELSLLGSGSCLDEAFGRAGHALAEYGAARLSLSPSPSGAASGQRSDTPTRKAAALSELGASAAARAQRDRLLPLNQAVKKQLEQSARRPLIVPKKVDQNSSDLCSSNSCSSSISGSGSSSSDESQFTQLVTSELAPDCGLLLARPAALAGPHAASPPPPLPPKVPERTRRRPKSPPSRLKRGALQRDSIRLMRMTRQAAGEAAPSSDSSGAPPAPQRQVEREEPARERRAAGEPAATSGKARKPWLFGLAPKRERPPEDRRAGELMKQQEEELRLRQEAEDICKVERMLRQMKPNQVFSSYSKENQSLASAQQTKRANQRPQEVGQVLEEPAKLARSTSGAPQVKEGAKSRDDLSFDARGNRTQRQVEERWRHQTEPDQSRETLIRQKMEFTRSTSISPPLGFADSADREEARERAEGTRPKYGQTRLVEQQLTKPFEVTPLRRSLSEERPAVAARKRQPEHRASMRAIGGPQRAALQPELPKFERTADDEFRKRVDYLRKLARANLTESPAAPSPKAPVLLTKPMATNWRGFPDPKEAAPQSRPAEPASTNLDSLHEPERAPPLAAKWRRSNSSLASVGRAPVARPTLAPRPISPQTSEVGRAAVKQPRELTSSAVVKLVVKEKCAPKLGYAFVEQRPTRPDPDRTDSSETAPRPNPQPSRAPLRVASPRSPEFGVAATSSNDDSAIASSVSSPSLSFMMNAAPPTAIRFRTAGAAPADSGALPSILRRHQLQQQQQLCDRVGTEAPPAELALKRVPQATERAPERRPPDVRASSPAQAQESAAHSMISPPKRVHFNDRTSIRSFESVSSLASNSTAVPNEPMRQQVGSPDSMGSGSTSRLSAESPDLRKGGGAAIYAIRGDPELELEPAGGPPQLAYPLIPQSRPAPVSYMTAAYAPPFVRMTAPPTINVAPQAHIQYVARPTSLTSTQIIATHVGHASPQQLVGRPASYAHQLNPDDDEDSGYALRLRQAATSRAFGYVASNSPTAGQQQQQQQATGNKQQQRSPLVHQQQVAPVAPNQSQPARPRAIQRKLDFQTEV